MISRITPSKAERDAGALISETIEDAYRRFQADGVLILDGIVDAELIRQARQVFLERYSRYLEGDEPGDSFVVGGQRLMIPVTIEPPFDHPQLFANPWLTPILSAALGEEFLIDAFGVVCSLPSAPAQRCHSDGDALYPTAMGLDRLLPAAAITVAVPLLEMNDVHGTTQLWPGSHRDRNRATTEKGIEPVIQEGSCALWDFRLVHGGTPNRSSLPRPLLYLTYCRPWFVDHKNFKGQQQQFLYVRASRRFLMGLSEPHRRLLVRARCVD